MQHLLLLKLKKAFRSSKYKLHFTTRTLRFWYSLLQKLALAIRATKSQQICHVFVGQDSEQSPRHPPSLQQVIIVIVIIIITAAGHHHHHHYNHHHCSRSS